jgi:hypothetical protein
MKTASFVSELWLLLRTVKCLPGCIQKFPVWPPGALTANGTALCH